MKKNALTLTEVFFILIAIGIAISLSIPFMNKQSMTGTTVNRLQTFNSDLENAVTQWKQANKCSGSFSECVKQMNTAQQQNSTPVTSNSINSPEVNQTEQNQTLQNQDQTLQNQPVQSQPLQNEKLLDFNDLKKYLKISKEATVATLAPSWLPEKTLNYRGNSISEFDFRTCKDRNVYMMGNGIIFSVKPDANGFWLLVDVNGKKLPNRIGKDTFHFTIGYTSTDINYNAREKTSDGICGHGENGTIKCDPNIIDPSNVLGASPTAFVIQNKRLPDYKALSSSIPDFKP